MRSNDGVARQHRTVCGRLRAGENDTLLSTKWFIDSTVPEEIDIYALVLTMATYVVDYYKLFFNLRHTDR